MKKFPWIAVLTVVALSAPVALAGEGPWLDPVNCAVCKNLSQEPGLLEHMVWETHKTTNGMLSVMAADPEYAEAWKRAYQGMMATVAKLQAGEQLHLCGCCTDFGMLVMAGAVTDDVDTSVGMISTVTGDSEELIEKIHAHADKTIEEFAKMEAAKSKS